VDPCPGGRAQGRAGGSEPENDPAVIDKTQRIYNSRQVTMAEIAPSCGDTPMLIWRNIQTAAAASNES
jgi:hypothetical protein